MSHPIELELALGGRLSFEIDPPADAPSSYFLFPNQPSLQIVWPFVAKILAAAHLPAVQYIEVLKMLRLKEADVAEESLREMLRREGYAFALPNPNVLPIELDRLGRRTFLFVSDPREAAAREYSVQGRAASDPVPFDGFLRSRALGFIATQYSRLTEFCRRRQHVKVIRCEDVVGSWYRLAIELVETLGLRIPPEIVFQISKSTAATARTTPTTAFRERLDSAARAGLEEKFAAEMAYFGYAPEEVLPAAFVQRQSEFVRAVCAPLAASPEQPTPEAAKSAPVSRPAEPTRSRPAGEPASGTGGHVENDPELWVRNKPNAAHVITVLGRRVVLEVDASGCRPVLGQPPVGEKVLAAYGCSYTFGWALPAEETFCTYLQGEFPTWRVENHGVGAYSSAQNLIQLRRNSRWATADYVTFCWIPSHLTRNVAEITWLQHIMKRGLKRATGTVYSRQRAYPRAGLDRDGNLSMRSTLFPRFDLLDIDFSDFRPEPYYLDLVAAAIFRNAHEIVTQAGGRFFVTVLGGRLSASLKRMLEAAGIPVVDASVNGLQYTCLPDDGHPNALANRIFADKIRDYVIGRETT